MRRTPRRICVATESGKDERDGDAELAAAVHRVLIVLTDLRSDAHAPELRERIKLVQWLRHELGAVETLLIDADARRETGAASTGAGG
jgi:hypothetical protein